MNYHPLGRTGLKVSRLALGTMTFGEQNSEREGHAQLDLALEAGINFIDTAEMYPVPPGPETYGATERIIGSWFQRSGKRAKVILATKAAGPAQRLPQAAHIRGGVSHFNRNNLEQAVNGSLARLKTDYIDLYQLHWPDRSTNHFGRLGYTPVSDEVTVPIAETLEALGDLVKAGKIRHIGVSNETPWGVAQFLKLSEQGVGPRIASIQNPYNLLNRTYEIGLAEFSHREDVSLLAYSPLAFGVLSGKYLHGARPEGARLTRWERFSRYSGPHAQRAVAAYVSLARDHGLDPTQLALAYVNSRPFVTSTIIGATSLEQLRRNIASLDLALSPSVLEAIEAIHAEHPNPAP